MSPVIGLDVAKGESQVQAYLDKKKPYKKSFKVEHNLEGLASLLDFIKELGCDRWTASGNTRIHRALSQTRCSIFGRQRVFNYYRESTNIL